MQPGRIVCQYVVQCKHCPEHCYANQADSYGDAEWRFDKHGWKCLSGEWRCPECARRIVNLAAETAAVCLPGKP